MMSFILENKAKDKRKDINDKETHVHGIREVFDENVDYKVRTALKTSVCNGKKEYKEPEYRNMLQIKDKYSKLLKEKGFKIKYEKSERITQSANASNQPS